MTKKREEKQYRIINLVMEYGHRLDGCKYAIATALPEEKLREGFKEELLPYEPYLYLTKEVGDAIVESQSNESKFAKRSERKETPTGYSEGMTEKCVPGAFPILSSVDPCDALITVEEEAIERKNREASIKKISSAMESLTEVQRRRLHAIYWQGKSTRDLATAEGVHHKAVDKSIAAALKKIRKKF